MAPEAPARVSVDAALRRGQWTVNGPVRMFLFGIPIAVIALLMLIGADGSSAAGFGCLAFAIGWPLAWLSWSITALHALPGLLLGLLVGRIVARPMNAVLGWLLRGFNRAFGWFTAVYGRVIGLALRKELLRRRGAMRTAVLRPPAQALDRETLVELEATLRAVGLAGAESPALAAP